MNRRNMLRIAAALRRRRFFRTPVAASVAAPLRSASRRVAVVAAIVGVGLIGILYAASREKAPSVSGTGTAAPLTRTQVRQLYAIGVDALDRKDYAEALEMFERVLVAKPDHEPSQIRAAQARKALKEAGPAAPVEAAPPAETAEPAMPLMRVKPRPLPPAVKRDVPAAGKGRKSSLTKQEKEEAYARGVALLNAGDYAACIPEFEKILAVDPAHQPSLIRVKKARAALRGR